MAWRTCSNTVCTTNNTCGSAMVASANKQEKLLRIALITEGARDLRRRTTAASRTGRDGFLAVLGAQQLSTVRHVALGVERASASICCAPETSTVARSVGPKDPLCRVYSLGTDNARIFTSLHHIVALKAPSHRRGCSSVEVAATSNVVDVAGAGRCNGVRGQLILTTTAADETAMVIVACSATISIDARRMRASVLASRRSTRATYGLCARFSCRRQQWVHAIRTHRWRDVSAGQPIAKLHTL